MNNEQERVLIEALSKIGAAASLNSTPLGVIVYDIANKAIMAFDALATSAPERSGKLADERAATQPAGADRIEKVHALFLNCMQSIGMGDGSNGWIEHADQGEVLRKDTLTIEGEIIFAFDAIRERLAAPISEASAKDDSIARSRRFNWTAQGMEQCEGGVYCYAPEIAVPSDANYATADKLQAKMQPGKVADPDFATQPEAKAEQVLKRKLIGYGDCRCILTKYCDGKCAPLFADVLVDAAASSEASAVAVAWAFPDGLGRLERVRDGYADSPQLVVNAVQTGNYTVPLFRQAAADRAARTPAILGGIAEDMKLRDLMAEFHAQPQNSYEEETAENAVYAYLDTIIQEASNGEPTPDDLGPLFRFYNAKSLVELARMQDQHIAKLQAKLPKLVDEFPRTPREG